MAGSTQLSTTTNKSLISWD